MKGSTGGHFCPEHVEGVSAVQLTGGDQVEGGDEEPGPSSPGEGVHEHIPAAKGGGVAGEDKAQPVQHGGTPP